MSDNLKIIEETIETVLDENGAPGSILALNHKAFAKEILKKSGKYTGMFFQARKSVTTFTAGLMSWESNSMNTTAEFVIKTSRLTADLNDFGELLSRLQPEALLAFKDYVGRRVFLIFKSYTSGTDPSGNVVYSITVQGVSQNVNYTYQDAENVIAGFELITNPSTAGTTIPSGTVIMSGGWDASTGEFPGGGTAQYGAKYYCVVAGIVDGKTFHIGDQVTALTNNAVVATYSGNWIHEKNTFDANDLANVIAGLSDKDVPVDDDIFLMLDSEDSLNGKLITWAEIIAMITSIFTTLFATKAEAKFEPVKAVLSAPGEDIVADAMAEFNVMDFAGSITGVTAECDPNNPPTGSGIVINIYLNDVTIFTTTLTIDAGEFSSLTATTPAVLDSGNVDFVAGDVIKWEIVSSGSTNPGQWLKSTVLTQRT